MFSVPVSPCVCVAAAKASSSCRSIGGASIDSECASVPWPKISPLNRDVLGESRASGSGVGPGSKLKSPGLSSWAMSMEAAVSLRLKEPWRP